MVVIFLEVVDEFVKRPAGAGTADTGVYDNMFSHRLLQLYLNMQILRRIPYWATIALLVYMPFHIFLAQSLSLFTGVLEVWKIGKDVILALAVLFIICLVWHQKEGNRLFNWLVGLSAVYFGLHLLLWGLNPGIYRDSAILGTIYNMRLPGFLVLGYGAVLLNPTKFVFSSILKVLLFVSTVVAALGVLQYLLPKDLLTHLGYGLDRGARPAFFIDDNPDFPRIMSTLREPNALGAYLILPFTALLLLIMKAKEQKRRFLLVGVAVLHAAAIFLTFSRSAWLGAALAVALALWWQYRAGLAGITKRWWPLMAAVVVMLCVVAFTQRNSSFVNSYITHSTPEEVEDLDSNDYHWLLVRQGAEGIIDRPEGHGPGTAGLVSIQNPAGSFLTENYYVQIGYEVGVLGLAVFLAITILVYRQLMRRGDYVAAALLASFWAYVLTNMFLHTWGNEAVAAQWWLLAGLALLVRRQEPKP